MDYYEKELNIKEKHIYILKDFDKKLNKKKLSNLLKGLGYEGLMLIVCKGLSRKHIDEDTQEDIDWLCKKIVNLRIFPDENNVMNKSLLDFGGEMIVVSQFTLHASTKKGNRPSYIKAAKPDVAIPMYEAFIDKLQSELGQPIQTGQFGADMKAQLVNDGPVTIIIDSKSKE